MEFDKAPILSLWEGSAQSHAEAHNRPALPLGEDVREVWHWIVQNVKSSPFWENEAPEDVHRVVELGKGVLRWERHTEFWSITYAGTETIDSTVVQHVRSIDANLITGIRIRFCEDHEAMIKDDFFVSKTLLGGRFKRGAVSVRTDFRQQENGCVNFTVSGEFENDADRGRFIKRVIDAEIYRFNTLKGLSLIRPKFSNLERLEKEYSEITKELATGIKADLPDVMDRFKQLSTDINQLSDSTRYRVTASRAYYKIVEARLGELGETIDGPLQSLSGFIDQRLKPAFNTIEAFELRAQQLERSASNSLRLYNTMIESEIQKQNQELLKSMDQRTEQQVRLSQAVEGFSVIALTYYGAGLLYYLLKARETHINELIVAVAIPFIALLVWWRTRRSKSSAVKNSDASRGS